MCVCKILTPEIECRATQSEIGKFKEIFPVLYLSYEDYWDQICYIIFAPQTSYEYNLFYYLICRYVL